MILSQKRGVADLSRLSFSLLFVNPQWKRWGGFECDKYSYIHSNTESPACSSNSPCYHPCAGNHPPSALVSCPDRPHLLPGAHVSACLSESRATDKTRHTPRKEPPPHTLTVRFQTHDRTTQSQPEGKREQQHD